MRISIRDAKTGKIFELEAYPENTPNDLIETLIEEGYIESYPGGNPEYIWVINYKGRQIPSNMSLSEAGVTDGAELDLIPVPNPG
mgnify:CR=1 FL=1